LLSVPPPASQPAVAKLFLLAAIAGDPVDYAAVAQLRSVAEDWPEEERAAFGAYLALVPPREPGASAEPAAPTWATRFEEL
jgi:hypothetical protein